MAIRRINRPVLRAAADNQVNTEPSAANRPTPRRRALAVTIDVNQAGRRRVPKHADGDGLIAIGVGPAHARGRSG
jgi:hypothetical protein